MTDLQYITEVFANEEYLKRNAKQIKIIDTTNDWGFDGVQSTTYIMKNGSSYTEKHIDNYSSDKRNETLYIYKIKNKVVTKDEFLKFNNIKRETSIKLWKNAVYNGKFDKLIKEYINNNI